MIDAAKQHIGIAAIAKAIGTSAVQTDVATLTRFGTSGRRPSAVVRPTSTDQIAQVLAAATAAGAALQVVCNSDGPLGQHARPGAIVLDLKAMNQIIEVNPELAYCLVEPGVTFRQLAEHLTQEGIPLAIDLPRNVDESIVASFQARQAGYTPYADHFFMQCGQEVMLADGRLVRLGMGAMPKSTCWQLLKFSYGPWVDGLFTQSANGITTKMGMWLMPLPPGYRPFRVTVPKEQDLGALLDTLRPLKTGMVIPNGVAIANATHEVALHGKKRRDFAGTGPMSASAIEGASASLGLGAWNLYGALYGLPDNVDIAWGMVKEAFSAISGAKVSSAEDDKSDPVWRWRQGMMRGQLGTLPGSAGSWNGGNNLELNPLTPVDGEEGLKLYDLSREIAARHEFDYLSEIDAVWRYAQHSQFLSHARDAEAKVHACAREMIEAQSAAGFGQARADPKHAALANEAFGGTDGPLAILHGRIKQALDPQQLFVTA